LPAVAGKGAISAIAATTRARIGTLGHRTARCAAVPHGPAGERVRNRTEMARAEFLHWRHPSGQRSGT